MLVVENPGEKIRMARLLRGWTQADLASRSGVSISTIYAIEGNRKLDFSARTARLISSVLDLPLSIFGGRFVLPDQPVRRGIPILNRTSAGVPVDYSSVFAS